MVNIVMGRGRDGVGVPGSGRECMENSRLPAIGVGQTCQATKREEGCTPQRLTSNGVKLSHALVCLAITQCFNSRPLARTISPWRSPTVR